MGTGEILHDISYLYVFITRPVMQTYKAVKLRVGTACTRCWYMSPASWAFLFALSDAFFDASLTKSVAAVWIDGSFFADILTYGAYKFFIDNFVKRLLNGFNC